jgi:NADPH:quinone reductase-like Zn-dependent oxidoreductase
MKAIRHTQFGPPDLLEYTDIEKPAPKENQVLIKVHASSLNAGDYRILRGKPFPLRLMMGSLFKPKEPRFGSDVAGRVEAVGAGVQQFQPGDAVFGCATGALAEYVLARAVYLAPKPAGCSFESAAAVPVIGLTAVQGLRDTARLQPGQHVLIQGASGGVGTAAIQVAKACGAEVTAVCSTRNLDMARSLGADHVIDYKREDFTRQGKRYDLIFAVNGYHPLSAYRRALNPGGMYVCAGGTLPQIFQSMLLGSWLSRKGDQKFAFMGIAKVVQEDLVFVGQLLESGKLTPVIDRILPLSQVPEGMRYLEEQHAQGKVVITVTPAAP